MFAPRAFTTLAGFLAEAALRQTVALVILDDSVNSFDYRRVNEIIKRVVNDESRVTENSREGDPNP